MHNNIVRIITSIEATNAPVVDIIDADISLDGPATYQKCQIKLPDFRSGTAEAFHRRKLSHNSIFKMQILILILYLYKKLENPENVRDINYTKQNITQ